MNALNEIRAAAPSQIEIEPLGTGFVVHSRATGAVVLSNDIGLKILSCVFRSGNDLGSPLKLNDAEAIASKLALPELSAGDTLAILSEWSAAGLFENTRRPFPDNVFDDGRAAPYPKSYSGRESQFSVATDDLVLAQQLDEILGCYRDSSNLDTQDKTSLRCVSCDGGEFGVFSNSEALWGRANRDVARYLLVREAAEALCHPDQVGAVLHGSAVLINDAALLILGESGRGKSTLAQSLVQAGNGFLADDHLPLHINGTDLLAFPTGSAVKQGARHLEEIQNLQAIYGLADSSRNGVNYIQIKPALPMGTAVPIRAIVFPHFSEGHAYEINLASPEQALMESVASGARPSRKISSIKPLTRLCDQVASYLLKYSDTEQSVSACLDIMDACKS